jgi:hypothetical protein
VGQFLPPHQILKDMLDKKDLVRMKWSRFHRVISRAFGNGVERFASEATALKTADKCVGVSDHEDLDSPRSAPVHKVGVTSDSWSVGMKRNEAVNAAARCGSG